MTATLGRPTGAETRLPGESAILPLASRENFTVASLLLGRATREHLMAIYGFARLVDQLGDEVDGDRLAILDDFNDLLAELAPEDDRYYRHDDMDIRTEGLDDDDLHPNGWSHARAGLLSSSSQSIPIVDRKLMLGRWQRVFFCELDRSRSRKVFIQVIGE